MLSGAFPPGGLAAAALCRTESAGLAGSTSFACFQVADQEPDVHVGEPQAKFGREAVLDVREFQTFGDPFRYLLALSLIQIHRAVLIALFVPRFNSFLNAWEQVDHANAPGTAEERK